LRLKIILNKSPKVSSFDLFSIIFSIKLWLLFLYYIKKTNNSQVKYQKLELGGKKVVLLLTFFVNYNTIQEDKFS
jgi:hypothetical protein